MTGFLFVRNSSVRRDGAIPHKLKNTPKGDFLKEYRIRESRPTVAGIFPF